VSKPRGERIDGVLLLDKPVGLSSNAALQRARRLYNAAKAGHTGTLDPLASGLLPLCFGEATKFAQVLLDAPKRYTATIRFGVTTTTADAEGDVLATKPVGFGATEVEAALRGFVGRIEQVPPAFAALKYQGRNYYEYARAGIDIPRAPRAVDIHALTLLAWNAPDAVVDVACSKGTYVRTLAQDLGAALGAGAHLAALRRTMTGGFALAQAVTLEALETMDPDARRAVLLPADAPVADVPRLDLDADQASDLLQGRQRRSPAVDGRYRAYGPGDRFLGLVEAAAGQVRAVRLVATLPEEAAAETAGAGSPAR
jgi:tRNA pseudouridine55 synthase